METVNAVLGLGTLGFLLVTVGMFLALVVGSVAGPTFALAAWLGGRRGRPAYAGVSVEPARAEVAR